MGSHVHACERELHHVLHLHSSITILSKAFQVKYEDVWQRPQTEFDAALLKLLTVRTSPCIIWSKLFLFGVELKALCQGAGLRLQMLLLHLTHTFSIWDVFILRSFEQIVFRLLVPFHDNFDMRWPPRTAGLERPLHGGMAEWLLLLRQEICDSNHSDHSQSEGPYLHEDSRTQKMLHLLQDLFLKNIPRHCPLQVENKWISKPASLLSSAGSVAHQQDNLLSLPTVLIGTLRWCCRLLYLCGYPVIICAILQVVLIEICMWASDSLRADLLRSE